MIVVIWGGGDFKEIIYRKEKKAFCGFEQNVGFEN